MSPAPPSRRCSRRLQSRTWSTAPRPTSPAAWPHLQPRRNLAAVGTNVFSLKLGNNAGNDTGTSQASPQVAGLAEYLWTIAPDLKAAEVATALRRTAAAPLAGSPCDPTLVSAPRLDAYAAVLSLDQAAPATPGGAPVRLALLDRNGDREFTHADLQIWVSGLPAADPPARTWGRADLNGDGFSGGTRTAAFDLNPAGSTRAGRRSSARPPRRSRTRAWRSTSTR